MSTVITYLTLIFQYNEMWTTAQPRTATFFEEHALMDLQEVGLPFVPSRKETHLKFALEAPLSEAQLNMLRNLKEQGICTFYVQDEITPDVREV